MARSAEFKSTLPTFNLHQTRFARIISDHVTAASLRWTDCKSLQMLWCTRVYLPPRTHSLLSSCLRASAGFPWKFLRCRVRIFLWQLSVVELKPVQRRHSNPNDFHVGDKQRRVNEANDGQKHSCDETMLFPSVPQSLPQSWIQNRPVQQCKCNERSCTCIVDLEWRIKWIGQFNSLVCGFYRSTMNRQIHLALFLRLICCGDVVVERDWITFELIKLARCVQSCSSCTSSSPS